METVQLQCGSCKKLMAIGVEHLGGQVRCPHCQAVVQTPAPAKLPASALSDPDATQREGLFADPDPTEAVLGGSPAPRVQAPAPVAPPPQDEPEDEAPLPKFKPRPIYDRGLLPIIALIFLVPYAFFATLFILYLLFFSPGRSDPLENLRDPAPNPAKGGPKRVERPKHDQPLVARWHTTLGKPIQAGDLLVTPQRIRLTADADLQLILLARNTSTNSVFEPIHASFVKFNFQDNANKPYSFIEAKSKTVANVYGMDPAYYRDAQASKELTDLATLKPGQEITMSLTTYQSFREPHVAAIVKSGDDFTWRIQVRRGFVKVDNKDVSATMVIGVDFSSAEIEGKKS